MERWEQSVAVRIASAEQSVLKKLAAAPPPRTR
jgi:hypothetical protein